MEDALHAIHLQDVVVRQICSENQNRIVERENVKPSAIRQTWEADPQHFIQVFENITGSKVIREQEPCRAGLCVRWVVTVPGQEGPASFVGRGIGPHANQTAAYNLCAQLYSQGKLDGITSGKVPQAGHVVNYRMHNSDKCTATMRAGSNLSNEDVITEYDPSDWVAADTLQAVKPLMVLERELMGRKLRSAQSRITPSADSSSYVAEIHYQKRMP